MADTPRVTVPVEDLAGKLKAIRDKFLMPTPDKDFTDYAIMSRCVEALSAAPAPEGGAVERACVDFQEAIDDFEADVADVMAEGSERADLWDREIMVNIDALKTVMSAALSTREEAPADPLLALSRSRQDAIEEVVRLASQEAPAEAGVVQRVMNRADLPNATTPGHADAYLNALLDYTAGFYGEAREAGMPAASVADAMNHVERAARGLHALALRAQPPAREDAQPVAWRVTNKATGHDQLFWKPLADLPFNRERFSTEPLYTHPAPDALREDAVAWTALADLVSWFTKPVQGQNGMVWVIPAGEQGADDAVASALAALQQEGRK